MTQSQYESLKRLIDILGSSVAILLFSPIMIVAAIWIKLVSPEGPVLADIKDRVGKGREGFRMYKFRSMIPNAQQYLDTHPELKAKYIANNYKLVPEEDPRIIRGGIFLRKFSIDELPQLFNILKGEMSLVGPRAYYFFEIEERIKTFPESGPYLEAALTVKPGLTGLWQVSGRSDIGFVERVKLDAEYARNHSLMYDVKILLKTPYVVLARKGAA